MKLKNYMEKIICHQNQVVYKSKVKNAQEAHEAIRPAGSKFIHPDTIKIKT